MKKETLKILKNMVQREIVEILYNENMLEWAKDKNIKELQNILNEIENELIKCIN